MPRNNHILRSVSALFLLLVCLLFFVPYTQVLVQQQKAPTAAGKQQEGKDCTSVSAGASVTAIVNVGLQWDFNKVYHLPVYEQVFFPLIVESQTHVPVNPALLPYFINIFLSSIVVNAP